MSDSNVAESGRTALRVAAVVLLVLVVAPFVVTGVPSVVGAEESFVVLSGSMDAEPEPVVQPGDVVIVDGVNPATIEEHDIITFTNGGEEPVTHRVVNVTEQDGQPAFRTKGDANEDADPQLIGPDQVIGEVIFVIPLIGYVVNFANTTQGFVLLVLLPIGLLVLSEVWNLVTPAGSSEEEPDGSAEPGRERTGPDGTTHAAGTAHVAGATRTAGASADADGPEEESDEGSSTVTLGRTQAKWFTVGLVPIAVATGYVAFRIQTAWILTVFFASIGFCLLSGLIYLRMRWGSTGSDADTESARSATAVGQPRVGVAGHEDGVRRTPVVTGRIERNLEDDSHIEVSVDSREELVEMAIEKETWVVHDTEVGTHVLVDDGVVFRYDEGNTTDGEATTWDEKSGWITFPESEDGETTERENGSDVDNRGGEERESDRERVPENVVESADSDTDGSGDTDGSSEESNQIDVGETPSSSESGAEPMLASALSDENVTPAIRRIDDEEAIMSESSSDSDSSAAADGPRTDSSVRADGAGTAELPEVVRHVGRIVDLPIRVLEFIGYLTVEPPMALYRALRPEGGGNENESRSQSDGRSEGKS